MKLWISFQLCSKTNVVSDMGDKKHLSRKKNFQPKKFAASWNFNPFFYLNSILVHIHYWCYDKTIYKFFPVLLSDFKLWSEMNRTTLGVGHFKTVSVHFFANCINSFHKTEDLTVILRGPTLFFNILIWSINLFSKLQCIKNS